MLGRLDSLNVSVSAAILLFEAASTRSASPSRRHPLLRGRPPGARAHRSSRGIQPTRYQQHTHFHPPYFQGGVCSKQQSLSRLSATAFQRAAVLHFRFARSALCILVYAFWSAHSGLCIPVCTFRSIQGRAKRFREQLPTGVSRAGGMQFFRNWGGRCANAGIQRRKGA